MKIGFIDVTATVSFGGVQTAVWQLAAALTDLGHEVHVIGGNGDIRPDLGGRDIGVHTFAFRSRERFPNFGSRFRRLAERYSMARNAKQAVAGLELDWVVLTKPFDFFWPHLMPAGSRTRFAFMSGGTDFFRGDRKLAKRIDAWMACSHFNAWQLQHHYKRFPKVIYNGVDVDHFRPLDGAAKRAELGIGEDEFVLAFAGRLVGWKGIRVAIDALAKLVDVKARLLLIGGGDALDELKAQAQKLGLAGRVLFVPAQPHASLPDWYAAADAGVFPSIGDEAFGITIAEAMACGLPVIASHIGGIPEVVGNEGSCGVLVSPGDATAIAGAVRHLLGLPDRGRAIGERARARIVGQYTWTQSAQRLLAALGDPA